MNALYEQLSLPDIPNSFLYIEEIRAERMQRITIPTKDQLGGIDQSLQMPHLILNCGHC